MPVLELEPEALSKKGKQKLRVSLCGTRSLGDRDIWADSPSRWRNTSMMESVLMMASDPPARGHSRDAVVGARLSRPQAREGSHQYRVIHQTERPLRIGGRI
jgi:hypothetical protein